MNKERWQEIERLYHAALERDEKDVPAFLTAACAGDEELRRNLEELIAEDRQAAGFLETPAMEVAARGMAAALPSTDPTGKAQFPTAPHRIGPYKLQTLLGRGGMGEVYLAKDDRLNRMVALKLLPAEFTQYADRVRRFMHEAKAASALNHPNILTVHDIGEAEGVHYIVTELITGETLRQMMHRTRLSLSSVLDIATQISSAFVAAHAAGIIHRDIKPENVMVRPDGFVKVVDFGLAKLTETANTAQSTDSATPTLAQVNTQSGVVIGTSYYLSPEQARGLKVDERTDIFSFGVVLYELLAARRPFEGATTSDVIVSILEREPPQLARYVPEAPAELQRIVGKALEKNCEERYQTMKDLQLDLKRLKKQLEVKAALERSNQPVEAVTGKGPTAYTTETGAARNSSVGVIITELTQHKTGVAIILLVAVMVLSVVAFGLYRLITWNRQEASLQTLRITNLTISGKAGDPAVSPDGKYIAYSVRESGQVSLWLRQVDTGTDIQIQPPTARRYLGLVFSPDGNYLYYGRAKVVPDVREAISILYRIPVLGGAPKKVHENVNSPIGFSPDGKQFVFIRRDHYAYEDLLMIANSDGSDEREVVRQPFIISLGGFYLFTAPVWSPDGKTVICSGHDNIFAVELAAQTHTPIPIPKWYRVNNLRWLSDGSGLIVSVREQEGDANQLWQVAYPGSAARRLTNDQNNYERFSMTADSKTLVAVQSSDFAFLSVAPAKDLRQATTIQSPASYGARAVYWTSDNKLVYISATNGMPIFCQMDADGSNQKQLTELPNWDSHLSAPCLTGDGKYIVYQSHWTNPGLWRIDLDGSNPKRLTEKGNSPRSSPDGKWIVYGVGDTVGEGSKWSAWKVPIDGGEAVLLSKEYGAWPDVSQDGKWVLCTRLQGGRPNFPQSKIAILPMEGGEPVKILDRPPTAVRNTYRWMPGDLALSFMNYDDDVTNIWRQPLDGGPSTRLTNFSSDGVRRYDWSRDGKQLIMIRNQEKSDVVAITNFR